MQKIRQVQISPKFIIIFLLTLIFSEIFVLHNNTNGSEEKEARRIVSKCQDKNDLLKKCYIEELKQLNARKPFEFTLGVLDIAQVQDLSLRDCHLVAHHLAASEVDKNPNKWIDIFSKVNIGNCIYGFVHGTIETRQKYENGRKVDSQRVNEICSMIFKINKTHLADEGCAHILGHLLLVDNLGDVKKAVSVCANVERKLRTSCNYGVFMESIHKSNLMMHGLATPPSFSEAAAQKQKSLCLTFSQDEAEACWSNLPVFVVLTTGNPNELMKLCNEAPTDHYKYKCYINGAGGIATFRKDEGYMKVLCKPFIGHDTRLMGCAEVVLESMIATSPKYLAESVDFCNESVPSKSISECYKILEGMLELYTSPIEYKSLCGKAPSTFQQYCRT